MRAIRTTPLNYQTRIPPKMKALISQQATWFVPFFHLFAQAEGLFWTVTSRYEVQQAVETYTFGSYEEPVTYSTTRTISASVTPTATPLSTATYPNRRDDVETVMLFYSPGAVAESDLEPTYFRTATTTDATLTWTSFLMPIVYTAPATCSSDFTFTTSTDVYVPSEVQDQLKPTSIETGKSDSPYGTPYFTEIWYLTEGAAPHTTSLDYIYQYYIEYCTKPYSYNYRGGSKYYDDDDDDDDDGWGYTYKTYCYGYCTSFKTWIIIIATLIPTLFVFGFLESWFWFRRLMTGRSALRMGTVCWVCISFWVLCFTKKQGARSSEDQKMLQEHWKNTSNGTAFKLWLKWGFRHTYPKEILGQFTPATTDIDSQGGAGTGAGEAQMQQQYGQVAPPPPVYMAQSGVVSDHPQYYSATKDGVGVTTEQTHAYGHGTSAQSSYPVQSQTLLQPGQPQQGSLPDQLSTTNTATV